MAEKNPLDMSDDEIGNMSAPPVAAEAETDEQKAAREAQEEEARVAAEAAEASTEGLTQAEIDARAAADGDDDVGDGDDDPDKKDGDDDPDPDKKVDDEPELDAAGKPIVKAPEAKAAADPTGSEAKPDAKDSGVKSETNFTPPSNEDAQKFFMQIMTPFKANGKTIALKSPEEVISLLQMGANYTRKLQDIQPHRKMLLMLQNNGLLDEGKLSYLIDLDKKNPEAIKKLIKDSGIDPLDIDAADDTTYQVGNHSVGDDEVNFRTTMAELVSSGPEGKETVAEIHDNWDDTSKEVLWKQPELTAIIHEARQNGVYDLIKAEVDRRKTIGAVPANTPFLQLYKTVGDEMLAEAGVDPNGPGKPSTDVKRDVLTTRAAAPKSKLANGDKASSASPTKASSKAAKVVVNPLAMKDEDFLKDMEGRL